MFVSYSCVRCACPAALWAQERDPQRKIRWRQALIAPDGRVAMFLRGLEAVLKQNNASPVPYVAGTYSGRSTDHRIPRLK